MPWYRVSGEGAVAIDAVLEVAAESQQAAERRAEEIWRETLVYAQVVRRSSDWAVVDWDNLATNVEMNASCCELIETPEKEERDAGRTGASAGSGALPND